MKSLESFKDSKNKISYTLQKAYEIHHKFQYSTNSQSQIAETYVTFVEHFLFATSLTLADYYLISPITDHVSSYFE